MTAQSIDNLFSFLGNESAKRAVFVSYHHAGDQDYYDHFADVFAGAYQIIRDNSLRQVISSDDPDYTMRRIREEFLTGTSCTIVLCGRETPWRKFVDWEIKATLDPKQARIETRRDWIRLGARFCG